MIEDVKWTKSFIESINERLEAVGLPKFVVDNGYVYKDEIHKILGIGIKLEKES